MHWVYLKVTRPHKQISNSFTEQYPIQLNIGHFYRQKCACGRMNSAREIIKIMAVEVALFDMPNSNRFDILSISIFSKIFLSISISIFFRFALSISISIFSKMTISISISIFFKSVDISTIDIRYRYIEQA